MLRQATKPTSPVHLSPSIHHARKGAYVVVSCPDDEFSVGSQFTGDDMEAGLRLHTWPQGIVFTRHNRQYQVSGMRLVPMES